MAQLPSKTKSDSESATKTSPEDVPPKKCLDDFISALPTREGWARPLIQYKKYWFNPVMLKHILLAEQAFVPRADDIILAAQPKSGTTWLKALVFAIANRARYSFSDHPLLTRHAQDVVPYIEIPGAGTGHSDIESSLPSPRILATHIPLSLLPPHTTTCGCRIVYLCRDPKDVLVSRLHFENSFTKASNISMDNAFSMFCEGFSPYGPLWDHCREYWEASLVRPNHIIFLKYEEIKADPVQVVRKLATFLGIPLTQEEESSGVAQEVARLCSFEMLTSLQVSKVGVTHHVGNEVYVRSSSFYRKGKVGDWANHMSQEMGEKLDAIVEEKLKGSGLVF
uniref:Uncharacterized protein n=1 Tax=Avena sativa TaxID=4498 RepID=A0ACD5V2K0_AVESA